VAQLDVLDIVFDITRLEPGAEILLKERAWERAFDQGFIK
jgi:hypothetical protein